MESTSTQPASPLDASITVKVHFEGSTRRAKMPLRDTAPTVLQTQIRAFLRIPNETDIIIERYSDSAAAYVWLDPNNQAVHKQLYRAAKAKSKLKLRVSIKKNLDEEKTSGPQPVSIEDVPEGIIAPLNPTPSEQTSSLPKIPDSQAFAEHQREARRLREQISRTMSAMAVPSEPELKYTQTTPEDATEPVAEEREQLETATPFSSSPRFAICCNSCHQQTSHAHYHCSTCEDGDFDLCMGCVDSGVTCYSTEHWLIKRTMVEGNIVSSTTEKLAPKPKPKPKPEASEPIGMCPGVRMWSSQSVNPHDDMTSQLETLNLPLQLAEPSTVDEGANWAQLEEKFASLNVGASLSNYFAAGIRTCNSCIRELPEAKFMHCQVCPDFDLCLDCFPNDIDGHHPTHRFSPAVAGTYIPDLVRAKMSPGRNQAHQAICDGCDKFIVGIRHKCLDCPDWDFCNDCAPNADLIHPRHRFIPVYEPLKANHLTSCASTQSVHEGICCDGPFCSTGKGYPAYIRGIRYKCAVCHDVDFCASCEASPFLQHNKSHPLIKFSTPIRNVSVTTHDERNGQETILGDRIPVEQPTTAPAASQPMVDNDTQVSNEAVVEKAVDEPSQKQEKEHVVPDDLCAEFVRDTVVDGSIRPPKHVFEQTWTLRNSGKVAWPAGTCVKHVAGDYMGDVDSTRPISTAQLYVASFSNACPSPILPGEEFSFTVKLRTPAHPGKVVSYWRVSTSDGFRFGHRLWCEVNVRDIMPCQRHRLLRDGLKHKDIAATQSDALAEKTPEVEAEAETAEDTKSSQMIFPKLEKESPVASVHEEVKSQASTERRKSSLAEEFDDCGQSVDWDASDDFLTDEEYDVLDASDEELFAPSK
ncbi:ZZ type zinc finger domain-containing protein [Emericellopsis atlantica]|uniref:ZZ type zinc finger domain-containing protein n=1 Tax=Emericellopsis atlantica TaxID=2614577 RepID=A0A9P7ZH87_9HYPO|nr:ZZ type zinc finger domain-containing protein [Emericellopsis atlantica]KAG9252069.1 ZZ type zinc finger domain-containing protein [Emericellopsis atlantica]